MKNQTLLVRAPMGALLALALAAPGTAFAYRDKDAINDCESRIRSEYGVSDLRDASAQQIMDTALHFKVQGQAKVDGKRYPWTCEVKNRHVVAAEYTGPKEKGLGTAEKLGLGAAAVVAAGLAANALSQPKETVEQAPDTRAASSNNQYPYRCEVYAKGQKRPSSTLACSYSQHQGGVNLDLSNGTTYSLQPTGSKPGTYVNMANDEKVYRKSGLGSKGVIYEFPRESIYLYY